MTDLPGYATHGYCPNCYSITHEGCAVYEEVSCDICGEFFPRDVLFEFTEFEDMTERTNLGCDLCMNYQEAGHE